MQLFLSGFFNNISGNIGVNTEIKLKNNNTISANIIHVMYTPNIRKNINILYLESLLEQNKLYKYSEDTYKIMKYGLLFSGLVCLSAVGVLLAYIFLGVIFLLFNVLTIE